MQPKQFTFIMEQTLGHIPFAQNLRNASDKDSSVRITWLKVDFPQQSWLEKLPIIRNNWSLRGSLKARRLLQLQNKLTGKPNLYFFHTQVISLFSVGWLRDKVPTIVSLDATPINYDKVGQAYGHQPGHPLLERFKFWMNRRAFHKATYLIAWSIWTRRSLIEDYGVSPDKVEVIPPGTNLEFWKKAAISRTDQKQDKLRLLFVGGDFERKGGKLLYEVFQKSLSEQFELHLVTKAEVTPGDGIFVYRNIQPNSPAIQEIFTNADIFVLPTEGDCLPVAITEAMAASLPVVSTRVGAIDEAVIDGVNGFLITPGDSEALASILNSLASDPELRKLLGKNSREMAEKLFDASKNGQRLLEICKNITDSLVK